MGIPFLVGVRGASANVGFDLSHSDESALIAIARDREVGIDLERIRHNVETLKPALPRRAHGESKVVLYRSRFLGHARGI